MYGFSNYDWLWFEKRYRGSIVLVIFLEKSAMGLNVYTSAPTRQFNVETFDFGRHNFARLLCVDCGHRGVILVGLCGRLKNRDTL